MSVRVRFAPSPTGYLHIGGARTALYCYLYAKATGGQFVLRVEDTDQERSTREFEQAQIQDIHWLGLDYDEGPDKEGNFGPYRQSERTDIYKKHALELIEKGHAFYCFCTDEELEQMKEEAIAKNLPPHYNGKYRDLPLEEAMKKVEAGEPHVIRFKVPKKSYTFKDHVRGEVTFPEDMVGDFVIIRTNGLPTYNYCCVIDDHLMEISHVFRAEDHLNNTVRQLMVYEALGAKAPEFAHFSLLVGEDRQKLSKRHGATSVTQYKEQGYLPQALLNYLCLLGWSHPEEKDIFTFEEIAKIFDLTRFNKAPALYDIQKLNFFNEQHLRNLSLEDLTKGFEEAIESSHDFHKQNDEWKKNFSEFFKDKVQLFSNINEHLPLIFSSEINKTDELNEALGWETTPTILNYIKEEIAKVESDFINIDTVNEWMNHIKKELKIKGKPLFMGMRAVLTGNGHGPDLKTLVSLTPIDIIKKRLEALS